MIRNATLVDAAPIAQLLGELGYPTTADAVRTRLGKLTVRVFVDDAAPLGVIATQLIDPLHDDRPVAMITALVVSRGARRRGIGKVLVDDAVAFAQRHGCGAVFVTSRLDRADAHAFYESIGLPRSGMRFTKRF